MFNGLRFWHWSPGWRWRPLRRAQPRPYIGFVYPAGGQQGTTFQIELGGQNLDDVDRAIVTGTGVSAKVVEYHRRLGSQEMTLLREQLTELKKAPGKAMSLAAAPTKSSGEAMMAEGSMMARRPRRTRPRRPTRMKPR